MTCKTSTGEEVWLRRMGGKVYCPLPSGYLVPYYVSLRVVLPGFLPLIFTDHNISEQELGIVLST